MKKRPHVIFGAQLVLLLSFIIFGMLLSVFKGCYAKNESDPPVRQREIRR
jgi:hypothetical protein